MTNDPIFFRSKKRTVPCTSACYLPINLSCKTVALYNTEIYLLKINGTKPIMCYFLTIFTRTPSTEKECWKIEEQALPLTTQY